MSDWGVFTYLDGTEFDAINSLTEDYVIDVIHTSENGSRQYPTGPTYTIDAYVTNASDQYAGGGEWDVPMSVTVTNGLVSWSTTPEKPGTVIVVMKNV